MLLYATQRLIGGLATLAIASFVVFLVLNVSAADLAQLLDESGATPENTMAVEQQYAADRSLPERYFIWLGGMLKGELGVSPSLNAPLGPLVAQAISVTLPLAVSALVLSLAIGISLGIEAARRRGPLLDRALAGASHLAPAVPSFWFGMLLVLLFSITLRWFPPGGFVPWSVNPGGAFSLLILPTLTLALPLAASVASIARTSFVELENSNVVRAARARGLTTDQAMARHGRRFALLRILATLGPRISYLLLGAMVVENVFYLPGLGRLLFDAVVARDVLIVRSALVVLLSLLAGTMFLQQLALAWADPRLRGRIVE